MKERGSGSCRRQDSLDTGGWEMMSIYGEMSMYGDIFIIDAQILIHAHAFSPPLCSLSVETVSWRQPAEEVNN